MDEPIPGTPRPEKAGDDRLTSWKEIANYLKRDVTTVQRWEKREGMPVHRHLHDKMGSVYAFCTELDDWARTRNIRGTQSDGSESPSNEANASPPDPDAATSGTSKRSRFGLPLVALAVVAALVIGAGLWLRRTEYFWKDPTAHAQFQTITEFEVEGTSAALSHDGHFVSLLSDRDGQTDVWITQVGSGQFHNLTQGRVSELVNPAIRTLGFSHDDSLVTFWVRGAASSNSSGINIWAVPTLGGQPKPYLEGAAEFDWSPDGVHLVYHTPGPGDPLFVSGDVRPSKNAPIYTAPAGLHSHFPLWSPDSAFIYFVVGAIPDKLDISRVKPTGGDAERITSLGREISFPVFVDRHTLLYLAKDSDGAGPWLYGMDTDRRVSHRLGSGLDRYTSLSASADGRRLLLTVASPKRSLWRFRIPASPSETSSVPVAVPLTSNTGFSPRQGPNYLLYVSANGSTNSIWKITGGIATELWSGQGAQIIGAPAISRDGQSIAFSVREREKTILYVMRADGTNARILSDALDWEGGPAWNPDGKSITSAANVKGVPHLFRVPLDGGAAVPFVSDYSIDPAWSPEGRFVAYSGPDIGTTFSVNVLSATNSASLSPARTLKLTRGARHVVFLPKERALVFLRGDIQHKNLYLADLDTGAERQLTNLPSDFDVRDFDISSDGSEVIFERVQQRSDVVLMDLSR
jgi:Tol biopolymer transport system component